MPAFSSRNIKTVTYGLQTISYMAPRIWDLVPKEMRQVTILNEFKAKIWKSENSPCRLCRTYLPADRAHYITLFNLINIIRLRVGGSLCGNINTAEIEISIKLTCFFCFFCQYIKNLLQSYRLYFYILKLTLISL